MHLVAATRSGTISVINALSSGTELIITILVAHTIAIGAVRKANSSKENCVRTFGERKQGQMVSPAAKFTHGVTILLPSSIIYKFT